MTITRNAWLGEKAMDQVLAAIAIKELAESVDQNTMVGPESLRERLRGEAHMVYLSACLFLAYATGDFPEGLRDSCMEAVAAGPEAMRQYAQSLESREHAGWDLPNPNYHSIVLGIERPK